MNDLTEQLAQQVLEAAGSNTPLKITGGDTKAFYGRQISAEPLDVSQHHGVINYQPKELVITARAGTTLRELDEVLAEHGQMLAFEPPAFGDDATLGGTIACGLSGPRRPYAGSARDFVLGAGIINGRGEVLNFGGEVMKNVAGYDVSRLMSGALGTLGIIRDISLKVLPVPHEEITLRRECNFEYAIIRMNELAGTDLPITATFYDGLNIYFRLSGTASAIEAGRKRIGGDQLSNNDIWRQLREHRHPFFQQDKPLWRLSVPSDAQFFELQGKQCIEWGGALRWLVSEMSAEEIRREVEKVAGHATLFRAGDRNSDVFHPLSPALETIHRNLKKAFDPLGIFNPGRMYQDL